MCGQWTNGHASTVFLCSARKAGPATAANAGSRSKNATGQMAECIRLDGQRTVARIVAVSQSGRAPTTRRSSHWQWRLRWATRLHARLHWRRCPGWHAPGTHLFHFLGYVEAFHGWGRGLRRAVAAWYTDKPAASLAYQAVKYRQRGGSSHATPCGWRTRTHRLTARDHLSLDGQGLAGGGRDATPRPCTHLGAGADAACDGA